MKQIAEVIIVYETVESQTLKSEFRKRTSIFFWLIPETFMMVNYWKSSHGIHN
jgi:hypothetical protein